jgi:hypothetical protein
MILWKLSAMNESTGKINPDQQMTYALIKPLLYLSATWGQNIAQRDVVRILITMHSAM